MPRDREENMSNADHQVNVGAFAALALGVAALDHPSPSDRLHPSWLSRHSFALRREPEVLSAGRGCD
jgi:hypothetical protein